MSLLVVIMAHVTAGDDHGTCVMSYLVAHVPSPSLLLLFFSTQCALI